MKTTEHTKEANFKDWIVEVERDIGCDEPLPQEGREEFRKYFDQGLSPSEAVAQDREDACV